MAKYKKVGPTVSATAFKRVFDWDAFWGWVLFIACCTGGLILLVG